MFIYHIALPNVWERFRGRPSYQPESLAKEGFIHCSYEHQIDAVLKRYYSRADKVLVLKIDTDKLRSKLVEEPSTGNDTYPHIYGRLNTDAIVEVRERVLTRATP